MRNYLKNTTAAEFLFDLLMISILVIGILLAIGTVTVVTDAIVEASITSSIDKNVKTIVSVREDIEDVKNIYICHTNNGDIPDLFRSMKKEYTSIYTVYHGNCYYLVCVKSVGKKVTHLEIKDKCYIYE